MSDNLYIVGKDHNKYKDISKIFMQTILQSHLRVDHKEFQTELIKFNKYIRNINIYFLHLLFIHFRHMRHI